MKTTNIGNGFRLTAMAAALLAAYGLARADEVDDLITPTSSISVGLAGLSGDSRDRALFGQYNGLREKDGFLVLDVDFIRRDNATGLWSIVQGRDLGRDSRELRAQVDRQGDWKAYADWWQLTRVYPRTVNTSLTGEGTTTPVVTRLATPGTGGNLDLQTERKRLGFGGEKWLGRNVLVEASYTTEDKEGSRMFGRGFTCPSGAAPAPVCSPLASGVNQWAVLFLPEPIDSTTQQFEAKATFLGERHSVTAGYYGSFYENHNGALVPTVTGNLNNPLGNPMGVGGGVPLTAGLRGILQLPMALPPDSQAHQYYVLGTYAFTPTTRATFKYAYTQARQTDDFLANGLTGAPAGVGNYGGKVNTTLAQAGLTTRPLPRLTLTANVRYEDREDKSPLELYNIEGANRFINGTYSLKKTLGKLEGSYLMPWNVRGTVGFEYEKSDRGQFSSPECIDLGDGPCIGDSIAGISALRAETEEKTWRVDLRRSLGETISGSVGFVHGDRDGSSWLKPASLPATGTTAVSDEAIFNRTGIFPSMFMNRKRDKVRAMVDWSPAERVSLQFSAEHGKDKYSAPTQKGLDRTGMRLLGVDASYAINDKWKLSAYYTYSEQTFKVAHSTGYIMDVKDKNHVAGFGLAGRPAAKWQVGLDLLVIDDVNQYNQGLDASASAANVAFLAQSGGLPDVTFKDTRLKVFGSYEVDKASAVRLEVIHDRQKLHEWTWANGDVPYLFSDNTTVGLKPDQRVTYVAVVYTFRFR